MASGFYLEGKREFVDHLLFDPAAQDLIEWDNPYIVFALVSTSYIFNNTHVVFDDISNYALTPTVGAPGEVVTYDAGNSRVELKLSGILSLVGINAPISGTVGGVVFMFTFPNSGLPNLLLCHNELDDPIVANGSNVSVDFTDNNIVGYI